MTTTIEILQDVISEGLKTHPTQSVSLHTQKSLPFDETKVHVTEAVDECLRKGWFRLHDTPRDYDDTQDMHWSHTGFLYEEWIRGLLRKRFPRELRSSGRAPVPEPLQGFYDLWWPRQSAVIDVKSRSVGAQVSVKDSIQVSTYAEAMGAEGILVLTRREDLSKTSVHPVENYGVPLATVQARAAEIETGLLPSKPIHFTPNSAPCAYGDKPCPFWTQCWGARPLAESEVKRLQAAEAVHDDLVYWRDLKAREKATSDTLEAVKSKRQEIEDRLRGTCNDWGVGQLEDVRRISVAGRTSYDVPTALSYHPELSDALNPFKKVGEPYDYFKQVKVKKSDA